MCALSVSQIPSRAMTIDDVARHQICAFKPDGNPHIGAGRNLRNSMTWPWHGHFMPSYLSSSCPKWPLAVNSVIPAAKCRLNWLCSRAFPLLVRFQSILRKHQVRSQDIHFQDARGGKPIQQDMLWTRSTMWKTNNKQQHLSKTLSPRPFETCCVSGQKGIKRQNW